MVRSSQRHSPDGILIEIKYSGVYLIVDSLSSHEQPEIHLNRLQMNPPQANGQRRGIGF